MSTLLIDIAERFYAAHGYMPSGIPRRADVAVNMLAGAETAGQKYGIDKASQAIIAPHIQRFQVKVSDRQFANLTLRHNSIDYRFANTVINEAMQGILAPAMALSFSRDKTIKETEIDNSNAVVVESWGTKQWVITMEGILVDFEEHWYPKNKLKQLIKLFEINDILEVIDCELLDDMGIHSIYLKGLKKFDFVNEYNDTIMFSIEAKSIMPSEFFI